MNPTTSVKFSYPIIPSRVIPSIAIGPTQGQRDTLTRVGFDPTVIYSEGRGFSFVTLIEMIGVHLIAVIAVAPTGKASFVYSYLQTRLRRHYNGKWPFSLVYVLKPLITAIRAITSNPKQACKSTEPELRNAFCSMYKPSFSLLAFVFVLSPQHWSWTLQAWNVHFLKVLHTSNRDKVRVCLEKGRSRVQEICYRWLLYNWRLPQATWSTKKSVATLAQLRYIWWMKLSEKKNEAGETLLNLKEVERKRLQLLKTWCR